MVISIFSLFLAFLAIKSNKYRWNFAYFQAKSKKFKWVFDGNFEKVNLKGIGNYLQYPFGICCPSQYMWSKVPIRVFPLYYYSKDGRTIAHSGIRNTVSCQTIGAKIKDFLQIDIQIDIQIKKLLLWSFWSVLVFFGQFLNPFLTKNVTFCAQ